MAQKPNCEKLLETRRPALGRQGKYLVFCSTAPRGGEKGAIFAAKPVTVMGFVDLQAVSYIPVRVLRCSFFSSEGATPFPPHRSNVPGVRSPTAIYVGTQSAGVISAPCPCLIKWPTRSIHYTSSSPPQQAIGELVH